MFTRFRVFALFLPFRHLYSQLYVFKYPAYILIIPCLFFSNLQSQFFWSLHDFTLFIDHPVPILSILKYRFRAHSPLYFQTIVHRQLGASILADDFVNCKQRDSTAEKPQHVTRVFLPLHNILERKRKEKMGWAYRQKGW